MKIFILIILVASAFTFFPASKNDWNKMSLNGKVKSLKINEAHRYKSGGEFTEWKKTYSHFYFFNKDGFITEYHKKDIVDSNSYKGEYSYNVKEKNITINYLQKNGHTWKTIFILDANDNSIEEQNISSNGNLSSRYSLKRDESGYLVEKRSYNSKGKITGVHTWKYDAEGNQIEMKYEMVGSGILMHNAFAYDDKGNKTDEIHYKSDGTIQRKYNFIYDDMGNKTGEMKFNSKGQLTDKNTWNYEYDKVKNWTKRTQSGAGGEPFLIEERIIEYY